MVLNNLSSIIIFIYFCSVAGDPRQHVSQASTLLLSHTPSLCGTLITVLRQALTFFFFLQYYLLYFIPLFLTFQKYYYLDCQSDKREFRSQCQGNLILQQQNENHNDSNHAYKFSEVFTQSIKLMSIINITSVHRVSSELLPESQKFQHESGQQTLGSQKCDVSELKENGKED